jgi:hypothetical protein
MLYPRVDGRKVLVYAQWKSIWVGENHDTFLAGVCKDIVKIRGDFRVAGHIVFVPDIPGLETVQHLSIDDASFCTCLPVEGSKVADRGIGEQCKLLAAIQPTAVSLHG